MKIISRYVLKEHVGPFVFALSALTSLMLLQYIARRFGDLVGRGLSWQVIAEFFLLSIPFTVAMTLPMAVLVAVLYAFSRLASENEITAFKAGGISTRRLMRPALIVSVFLAIFMLWFNDQVLSRANHELATLQLAILRTKPTFALKEQVINTVKEGQLYLRAGYIDRDQSGKMRDITIYDLNDPTAPAHDLREQRHARLRVEQARSHHAPVRRHDAHVAEQRGRAARPGLLQGRSSFASATSPTRSNRSTPTPPRRASGKCRSARCRRSTRRGTARISAR